MGTRIALIADLHANLPALEAFLADVAKQQVDEIVHLGDMVGIGPFPLETFQRVQQIPHFSAVLGNHDHYYLDGFPEPLPVAVVTQSEADHHAWVRQQMGMAPRQVLMKYPEQKQREISGIKLLFTHYAFAADGKHLATFEEQLNPEKLDAFFPALQGQVVCMGHDHQAFDLTGRNHYLNPGSLGCQPQSMAPYLILELAEGAYTVEKHSAVYSDADLKQAFSERNVPAEEEIKRIFFGNRF